MDFMGGFLVIGFLLIARYCYAFGKLSSSLDFHYTREKTHTLYLDPFAKTTPDDCKLCYGHEDCLVLENSWCSYYAETSKILGEKAETQIETENKPLKTEVDNIMFDMMRKASDDDEFEECIPFVSEYTNCNKDTICTGCQTCSCDVHGLWSCSPVEQCQPRQVTLDVDHKVLLLAMESLTGLPVEGERVKRSDPEATDPEVTYRKISEWMNEVQPRNLTDMIVKPENKLLRRMMENIFEEMHRNKSSSNSDHAITDFTFDDLLRSIINKNANDKPDLITKAAGTTEASTTTIVNSKLLDLSSAHETTTSDEIYNDLMFFDGRLAKESSMDITAQGDSMFSVVQKREVLKDINSVRISNNNTDTENKTTINMSNDTSINNIHRHNNTRPTNSVETRNNKTTVDYSEIPTGLLQNFNDSILKPINNIIADKQNEIDNLLRIREDVLKCNQERQFINLSNRTVFLDNDSHITLFKLEIIPTLASRLRTALNGHMTLKDSIDSMKRDLIRVLGDVAILRKLLTGKNIPKDLKYLVSSIKYYIQEHARRDQVKLQRSAFYLPNTEINLLKDVSSYAGEYSTEPNYVKERLMKILRAVDKGLPQSNGLSSLSHDSKRVMKRTINHLVSNEIMTRQKYFKMNVIKELKYIDFNLNQLLNNLISSKNNDRLHKLKLTHLEVSVIINKLKDVLATINVYKSRRIHVDEKGAKIITRNIKTQLEHIIKNIDRLFMLFGEVNRKVTPNVEVTTKRIIKTSFFKRLKTIVGNLVHKKKQTIKTEETKDLTEKYMKEYENSMLKWQHSSKPIQERIKRSTSERMRKLKNRIQNIIPKYLRTKVNPAVVKKVSEKAKKNHKVQKRAIRPLTVDLSISESNEIIHEPAHKRKPQLHPALQRFKFGARSPEFLMTKLGSTEVNGTGYEFYEMKNNPFIVKEMIKYYNSHKRSLSSPTRRSKQTKDKIQQNLNKNNRTSKRHARHKEMGFFQGVWKSITDIFG